MEQTEKNNSEFQKNNQNPEGQAEIKYSEEEYKNLQAFWTKANQALIDMSKKLAEKDPKELLNMESKIQNKIIKEVWGYDNLDELRIMLPDVLEGKSTEEFNNDETSVEKMEREYRLLKMKLEKKDIDDEIDKYVSANSKIVSSIPNFSEKIKEELKSISSNLPSKERVNKATKLISNSLDIDVETYLQLQWKTMVKSSEQKLDRKDMVTAQNQLRKSLWLKEKK